MEKTDQETLEKLQEKYDRMLRCMLLMTDPRITKKPFLAIDCLKELGEWPVKKPKTD